MAALKFTEQFKVSVVRSLPRITAKAIQLGYRGVVISIHFIRQLLIDATGK